MKIIMKTFSDLFSCFQGFIYKKYKKRGIQKSLKIRALIDFSTLPVV